MSNKRLVLIKLVKTYKNTNVQKSNANKTGSKEKHVRKWKWDMGKNKGRETSKKHKKRFA